MDITHKLVACENLEIGIKASDFVDEYLKDMPEDATVTRNLLAAHLVEAFYQGAKAEHEFIKSIF